MPQPLVSDEIKILNWIYNYWLPLHYHSQYMFFICYILAFILIIVIPFLNREFMIVKNDNENFVNIIFLPEFPNMVHKPSPYSLSAITARVNFNSKQIIKTNQHKFIHSLWIWLFRFSVKGFFNKLWIAFQYSNFLRLVYMYNGSWIDRKLRNLFSATRSSPNQTESNALLRPTGIHLLRVRRCLFYSSVHCSRSPCRSPLIKTCCRWYTTREGCQLPHTHVSLLAKTPLHTLTATAKQIEIPEPRAVAKNCFALDNIIVFAHC